MKVMIVSDTHRVHGYLERMIQLNGRPDLLIHLGDVEGCREKIEQIAGCPVEMVCGNCDNAFLDDLPMEKVIYIGSIKILLVHGHMWRVNFTLAGLVDYAKSINADYVMFGHTHKPLIEKDGGLTIINPGSISFPRQEDGRRSIVMMYIDERENVTLEPKYL
ncbi:MAG: metallophosphoesterase [Lachnospiraceae bacterium]|nr:metallophosphoesterase [Lachnospiraceae bacterium]